MFGVLPNYATVDGRPADDGSTMTSAISTRQSFRIASLNSFDPVVYPYVGLLTAFNGNRDSSYGGRYMRAFADNSIGNFMTTAVVPSLTNQDSRYFRSGEGGILRRMGYAAGRSAVTRTRSGHAAFNISEIGGNRSILVTVLSPQCAPFALEEFPTLFTVPVQARPGWCRYALDVRVPRLTFLFRSLAPTKYEVEHVFDY